MLKRSWILKLLPDLFNQNFLNNKNNLIFLNLLIFTFLKILTLNLIKNTHPKFTFLITNNFLNIMVFIIVL